MRTILWSVLKWLASHHGVIIVLNRDDYTDEYGCLLISKQFVNN